MGSILHAKGVAFRVWAPHAQQVSVIGSFNDWDGTQHPMLAEENGYWYANVPEAHAGDQYRFLLSTPEGEFKRIDPYAREVTTSVGNAIVHDPSFDWQGDDFQIAPWNELVIYELHIGTFNDQNDDDNSPGQFASVSARLGHLKKLGVNAIQIMPIGEFAGDRSWGYNPAHIFSVEISYGGPLAFKQFVRRAHRGGHRGDPGCGLQPPRPQRPRPLAVRRLERARSRRHLLLQRQSSRHPVGRNPPRLRSRRGASIPLRQRPICGLRSTTWTGCASTLPSSYSHLSRLRTCRICPRAGACSSGMNSQIVERSTPATSPLPKTCRTTAGSPKTWGQVGPGFSCPVGCQLCAYHSPGGDYVSQDEERSLVCHPRRHSVPIQRRRL
jgi:hypothetical protein